MAFVPVANTVEVDLIYTWAGQICENVMFFQDQDGDPTLDDVQALAGLVRNWADDQLLPFLSDEAVLYRLRARSLTTSTSPTADQFDGTVGGIAVATDPNNVTIAISFRTGLAGRAFRGRNYIIGLPNDQISGNFVSPTFQTNVVNAYGALQPIIGSTWKHAVVSRYLGGFPRVAGVATPVTAYVFSDNVVDSQRRRLPGRGR